VQEKPRLQSGSPLRCWPGAASESCSPAAQPHPSDGRPRQPQWRIHWPVCVPSAPCAAYLAGRGLQPPKARSPEWQHSGPRERARPHWRKRSGCLPLPESRRARASSQFRRDASLRPAWRAPPRRQPHHRPTTGVQRRASVPLAAIREGEHPRRPRSAALNAAVLQPSIGFHHGAVGGRGRPLCGKCGKLAKTALQRRAGTKVRVTAFTLEHVLLGLDRQNAGDHLFNVLVEFVASHNKHPCISPPARLPEG
jgi:hypothetical protein